MGVAGPREGGKMAQCFPGRSAWQDAHLAIKGRGGREQHRGEFGMSKPRGRPSLGHPILYSILQYGIMIP